jgi:hypothetical protein
MNIIINTSTIIINNNIIMSISKFKQAVAAGDFDIMSNELANGVEIDDTSYDGICGSDTPLSYVSAYNNMCCIIHFLLDAGADISANNYKAVKLACKYSNLEALHIFIDHAVIPSQILTECFV